MIQVRPHILDASALVELFSGHPRLMRLLDDADAGDRFVIVPTLAIAEAQAVLNARQSHWDRILGVRSLLTIDLSPHVAVEIGRLAAPRLARHPVRPPLAGPLMTAQVLHEAQMLNGVIVTRLPEPYDGHDVAVQTI
ncbi:PIN domain-containing protein [Actinoplanes philippinensis]|uniref:PIN domain-containing protein n=1 Tax=Actinoplanes philippinensis TaxID=35752 RepID=UPI0033F02C9E